MCEGPLHRHVSAFCARVHRAESAVTFCDAFTSTSLNPIQPLLGPEILLNLSRVYLSILDHIQTLKRILVECQQR